MSLSARVRRIWVAVAATVLGLVALAAAGWWLERARSTDLKDPTAGVTAAFVRHQLEGAPALSLRDVAAERGLLVRHGPGERSRLLPEDTGSGLAWGDFDGDGYHDLYVVNFPGPLGEAPDPRGGNRLFRNLGGRFVEVTERAGVADLEGFGMGAVFVDFDGDGHLDLYVTNYGPNRLFRNRGDGTFEEVAAELGLDDPSWSIGAAWGDLDQNGALELYLANYVDYEEGLGDAATTEVGDPHWRGVPYTLNPNAFEPLPNRLFRRLPSGAFADVSLEAGISDPGGRSMAATMVDLDGDGWLDLYVTNDVSPNALFRNLGGELDGELLFADLSSATGTADPRGSMGLSVGDLSLDGAGADGLPDLFITHWVAQENALYQAVRTAGGRLEYRDRARALDLAEATIERVGWGAAFVDFDLDGRDELVVANGSTLENAARALLPQPMFLFWNDGKLFRDATAAWSADAARPRVARGLAVADFDLDGDPDLAISVNRGEIVLLENEGAPRRKWLAVRLDAPEPVTRGARVELHVGGHRQVRWLGADVSYASQHAPELLFGLGDARRADLEVHWVGGGSTRIEGLPASRRVTVRRGP